MKSVAISMFVAGMVPWCHGQAVFSQKDKSEILKLWSTKCSYESVPAGAAGSEWVVRLTPTGSKWIRELYRQFQSTKVVPTSDPRGGTDEQQEWIAWLDRQVERDWSAAEDQATRLNQGQDQTVPPSGGTARPTTTFSRRAGTDRTGRAPSPAPNPQDPCPARLVGLIGAPPKFAAPVRPFRHTVKLADGSTLVYTDNVKVRPKYAYYRFAAGVNSEGRAVASWSQSELSSLFAACGLTQVERNVMKTVSVKEGGFDSVNTYDTGYVSVGFVQFASLAEGSGSLGEMMALYKSTRPQAFYNDFERYGLSVSGSTLVAIDLETGDERTGSEANAQIIADKRLIAVFQRAGQKSRDFQIAQVQSAKEQFYPANDTCRLTLGGQTCDVRIGDVFSSEASLATLMDRKVNTGNIRVVKDVLERLATEYNITTKEDLSSLEFVATRALAWRTDYTNSTALSRPRDNSVELSRRGGRLDRKGGTKKSGTQD
ncbi:MAG: hypothetical protein JNM34_05595 [Chthonomonadaceae bacterium]|nr:hypothetical protein [Chthonomonadaceae bacterium]